jgi:hypothetical protein
MRVRVLETVNEHGIVRLKGVHPSRLRASPGGCKPVSFDSYPPSQPRLESVLRSGI